MADPPVLHLLIENGPRKGESLQCSPGAVTRVGRVARGNALAVRDAGASQKHLAFEFLPASGRWAVSDLASCNGTLLNGAALRPSAAAPLADGDRITIGESTVIAVSLFAAPSGRTRSARHEAAAVAEPEVEEEVVRRGGRRRAALPLPPPARARSARIAAKKGEALGSGEEEEVVEKEEVRGGRRAVTRASARKGKEAVLEEEEEEEEVVLVPRRGRRERSQKARANSESALKGGGEVEEEKVLGGGEVDRIGKDLEERIVPDSEKDERAAVGSGEEEAIQKALEEEVPVPVPVLMPRRGRRGRQPKARANLANVAKDYEENGKKALGGGEGDRIADDLEERIVPNSDQEDECAAVGGGEGEGIGKTLEEVGYDMDNMTLGEWFDGMEKFLPKVINDVAEEMIAALREKSRLFDEYVATSSDAA